MKRGNQLYKNITGDVVRLNDSSLSWITAGATREYFGHGEKKKTSPRLLWTVGSHPNVISRRSKMDTGWYLKRFYVQSSSLARATPGVVYNEFIPESRSVVQLDQTAFNPTA